MDGTVKKGTCWL